MTQRIEGNRTKLKRGINGSTLKLIAIVTMLIDHVGAVVVLRMVLADMAKNGVLNADFYEFYNILRGIGRVAFPIFCFLIVEGFQRTRNRIKYALRFGIFALVSEIPFDLAFSSKVLEFSYQNVFFTLLVALLTMIAVDAVDRRFGNPVNEKAREVLYVIKYVVEFVIMAVGAFAAELLQTDYGAEGVACIMVLYLFRWNKMLQAVAGFCSFLWERIASFAFIPIAFYNGERGLKLKYVFYLFYPLHLMILYLICVLLGIEGYSIV